MPPKIAALFTYGFVFWLFLRDAKEKPNITGTLWLPVLWVLLIATRHPAQWFDLWGIPGFKSTSLESGNNLDASIYVSMILIGVMVLMKRGVSLIAFAQNHTWLIVFILYCLVAIIWSDYPFVSFKRWIKILGHPVMTLLVLTEPDPDEAVKRLIKRCTYVLVPISILWIKYFPTLGRKSGGWASQMENCGIATGKNMLGANCFVLGIFLVYFLIQIWPLVGGIRGITRSRELRLLLALLAMNTWCFYQAHSATSWSGLFVGAFIMIYLRKRDYLDSRIGFYAILAVAVFAIAEVNFDVTAMINHWRGKIDTFAGRQNLWNVLLHMHTNPIIGTGFEGFWLGKRLETIWAMPEFAVWKPNEAHNGYLEIYLTLGILGLIFLGAAFFETYRKCLHELKVDRGKGLFRLGCTFGILTYAWAEAVFRGLSLGFFLFFFIAITARRLRVPSSEEAMIPTDRVSEREALGIANPSTVHQP
jgi:exopolysaccharide production protein ExoQ